MTFLLLWEKRKIYAIYSQISEFLVALQSVDGQVAITGMLTAL